MDEFKKIFVAIICLGVVAGCGFSRGFIRDSVSSQQRLYEMSIVEQTFIRTVSASATAGSIFCLFPISGQVYQRAMEKLYASAHLVPNQTLLNLREDHDVLSVLGFYCSSTLTLSGDIIQLTPAPASTNSAPSDTKPGRKMDVTGG